MSYAIWLPANAPTYMADQYGQAWLAGIGAAMDDYVAQYVAATMAQFPDYAPPDALGVLGDEMQIDRGPNDTDASYALRLVGAWLAWKYAGTPIGLLSALYWAGFGNGAVLVQQNGLAYNLNVNLVAGADPITDLVVTACSTLATALTSSVTPPTVSSAGRSIPAGNSWWKIDDNTDFCSRFAVLFPFAPPFYPFGAVDLARLQATIKKWRPAKATCVGVNVLTSGEMVGWPPSDTIGDGGTFGGTVVTYAGA